MKQYPWIVVALTALVSVAGRCIGAGMPDMPDIHVAPVPFTRMLADHDGRGGLTEQLEQWEVKEGYDVEVVSCLFPKLDASKLVIRLRKRPAGSPPAARTEYLNWVRPMQRVTQLERAGYTVDVKCATDLGFFGGPRMVIQYRKAT